MNTKQRNEVKYQSLKTYIAVALAIAELRKFNALNKAYGDNHIERSRQRAVRRKNSK